MPKISALTVFAGIGDCLNMAIPNSCIPFCCEGMVCLKKIACLLACCCLLSLGTLTAFAKDSSVYISEDQITIAKTQTAFEAVIEVEPENTYAGVEIGIACPEDVTVTASSGSSGSMSAGPVLANGLYWASFFESDNKLSGIMKITLQFSCDQSFENGDISIKKVKVLTKDGVSVVTEELTPSLKVNITRNGSDTAGSDTTSKPSGTDTNTEPTESDSSIGKNDIPATGNNSHLPTENDSSIGENDIPATGDNSHLPTGIAVLFVSGCAALGMIILFGKRRKFD